MAADRRVGTRLAWSIISFPIWRSIAAHEMWVKYPGYAFPLVQTPITANSQLAWWIRGTSAYP